jgi:hypothetical protein
MLRRPPEAPRKSMDGSPRIKLELPRTALQPLSNNLRLPVMSRIYESSPSPESIKSVKKARQSGSVGEGLSSPLVVVSETDLELSGGTRIALQQFRSHSAWPCWPSPSPASVKAALQAHHEQDTNPRGCADLHDPHIPLDSLSGKSTARYIDPEEEVMPAHFFVVVSLASRLKCSRLLGCRV